MSTSDDSLRGIPLGGKQLVFIFMAVTVVAVVIFLCGVLVGRGAQSNNLVATVESTLAPIEEVADPTSPDALPPTMAPAGPTAVPDLNYQDQLESTGPAPERLSPAGQAAGPAPGSTAPRSEPTTPAPPTATTPPVEKPAAPDPAFREPRGDGFAIQVAALSNQVEAEAVAGRLKAKGYAAFILSSSPGQPSGFKVRVGKFKTRAEAEKIATRLEREEQFKPWITR